MVKRATDRRVQRTRQLLQDALISMMIEQGYEATTVQDIIDRANVGRATFYAHFADKETLLTSRLEDLRNFLGERQRQAPGGLHFSLAMLEHARSHLPVWPAFVGVLTWWLDQGAKLPPEEVDAIFRRLVMQGVAGEWGLRANAKGKAER